MKYELENQTFLKYLNNEDKQNSVSYAIHLIESKKVSIEALYMHIIAPALMNYTCDKDKSICIWKEHKRTSIIRTILESSYLYIVEERKQIKKINQKIIVLTPSFEYHEIAAIMVAHFLLLEGFKASYIGANTPKEEIISALKAYQPDYIALSVTNPYNIVITKQICDEIKIHYPNVKIILGGQAFLDQAALNDITYDFYLKDFIDIKKFAKEVRK